MNHSKQTHKTRCKHCDGRGELYNGCPDAVGVDTERCTACKGRGWTGSYPSSIISLCNQTALERTFVLADLFTVEPHSTEVPDHILESDPSLEWVTCPCCDGELWLETEGNGWTTALFSDHRRAYAHRHLNHSYKLCERCNGVGEVLDFLTSPVPPHALLKAPQSSSSTFLHAA
jgi:hypothetical protein